MFSAFLAGRLAVSRLRIPLVLLLATAFVAVSTIPASSAVVLDYAGTVVRVNVSSTGQQADLDLPPSTTYRYAATNDGRYVVWHSAATNLVSGDTNGKNDVFWRDTITGSTKRVSVSNEGAQSANQSYVGDVTDGGRYVVFHSNWSGFVEGDTGRGDVFIRDMQASTTVRAVMATGGLEPNGDSYVPCLSPDGRYLAFLSTASNLVDDDENAKRDAFVRDRNLGTNTLVSVSSESTQSDSIVDALAMSDNGRYVAFITDATTLVDDDTNGARDAFFRDIKAGTTVRVSVDATGAQAPGATGLSIGITADGRYVAFSSFSPLVEEDTNEVQDVYVRDMLLGTTTLASRGGGGVVGDSHSIDPAISPDGTHLAFRSLASNMVSGDTSPSAHDIYVRDLQSGAIARASVNGQNESGDSHSWFPVVGPGGSWVLFGSKATNLVNGDTNTKEDIFLGQVWTGTVATLAGPTITPAYKAPVRLTARLKRSNGRVVIGESVIFERWTGKAWQSMGTAKTGSAGYAVRDVAGITAKTTYRARLAEHAPYRASSSANVHVLPKVRLTRSTSWRRLTRGKTYYAKGFISPRHARSDSNKVKILAYKRRSNGTYRYVKSFTASYSFYSTTKTRYRAAVRLTSAGKWKLVARHAADDRNAKTYGSPDYVTVK